MDCETPLRQAADAVLQRNALIVTTLDGANRLLAEPVTCPCVSRGAERPAFARAAPAAAGLAKLRAGAPPSEAERALFAELRDNLVSVAALVPPRLLLPQDQPPMQTFMATSRAMGAC